MIFFKTEHTDLHVCNFCYMSSRYMFVFLKNKIIIPVSHMIVFKTRKLEQLQALSSSIFIEHPNYNVIEVYHLPKKMEQMGSRPLVIIQK